MSARTLLPTIAVTVLFMPLGCATSSDAPSAEAPSSAPTDEAAPAGDAASAAQVVCHLDCSGNQADGYGATEEEARADVSQHVEKLCKPEDGQYFIFCDPPK